MSDSTAGLYIERDVMVPARDGVHLATDVYLPDGGGPFPVVLERTPYDKTAPSRSEITAADPKPRSGAGTRGHRRLDRAPAAAGLAARRFAAGRRAGIRGVPVRAVVARRLRRLLATGRHLCRGLLRPLCQGADRASVRLVRPLCPHRR